jgi:nitrite reductase (NO-forming)
MKPAWDGENLGDSIGMKLPFNWSALAALACGAAMIAMYRSEVVAANRYTEQRSLPDVVFDEIEGEEIAAVTAAPNVPPPLTRRHATKVLLRIEVREHTKALADGVNYTYWTFGNDAPGNFIRIRVGDLVETTLSNHPDNSVAHNVDFHAATGPGGGGETSFVAPGHSVTFSWRAMRPGLFLYHCVAAPAGLHIANGMYGLILVEPKEGMPKVDREFFVVQGEFYTRGAFGESGHQEFSLEKALHEQPEYVVFNGHVGALMGKKALRVRSGESIRMYVGNAGPSLVSSFHIVGEIFDRIYGEGGSVVSQLNAQTTVVPVGGSAMVEFVADVPGSYQFVDHSMFRAFNKGAMGAMEVEGAPRADIFSGTGRQDTYAPGTRLLHASNNDAIPSISTDSLIARGMHLYQTVCAACHQADGRGLPNAIPPLAGSDFLLANKERAVRVLLQGLSGPIVVNGKDFNGVMPKLPLTDEDIAGALSFVRSSFGNSESAVSIADVRKARTNLLQELSATAVR